MEESILKTIKKLLGPTGECGFFDDDIIRHTNTVLGILYQAGVGDEPFTITGNTETWGDFLGNNPCLEMVKSYIALRVRKLFDPPTGSSVSKAMDEELNELIWRINVEVDPKK